MPSRLIESVTQRVLLGDGAMGTQLQQAGLESGGCGEAWNIDQPDRVLAIQKGYVDAGSDCIITNTFGASQIMLTRHKQADKTIEINRAAVEIARKAFGNKKGFVLGDIGPFGGIMEPIGEVPQEEVYPSFLLQAKGLVEAGADAIIIETQTDPNELTLAVRAAREAGAQTIIASFAFDLTRDGKDARTMMGTSPEQAAELAQAQNIDILALNCGTGMDMPQAARVVGRYRKACDLPIMAQPNAGVPVIENGTVVYKESPEEMSAHLPELIEAGARIVGACCGSTPGHIRAFRTVLEGTHVRT